MRPIQFKQDKKAYDWKRLFVGENTSYISYQLKLIRSSNNLKGTNVKKKIANLLTDYYSILFNPDYRDYFRPMTDLTLLFPIDDEIYISADTNFILVPLPLPTYRQHVQARYNNMIFRLAHPCPFIKHTSQGNEAVYDMDYSRDNRRVMKQRQTDERNIKFKGIQHTNPATKQMRLEQPLDITARLRVYKFDDIPPEEAKLISSYPRYSMAQRVNRLEVKELHSIMNQAGMSEQEFFNKIYSPKARTAMNVYNQLVHRQYTFLEITSYEDGKNTYAFQCLPDQDVKNKNKLSRYSKKFLQVSQLTPQFADCFDFKSVPRETVVQFFLNNLDGNEFSPIQIMSGITKLKNIIKYKKPKNYVGVSSQDTSVSKQQTPSVKFNQHVRSLNIKQADGTYKVQLVEDNNIIRRTSLEDTKPLSSNQGD